MKPAVEWISRPSRPSELFPSNLATRSSGSWIRSSVEPSTNSPGCRMNGRSASISTSSVSSSCGSLTSMYAYRALWKTRKKRSTRTSTLDGWSSARSYGSIPIRPSSISRAMVRSERTTPRFYGSLHGALRRSRRPRSRDRVLRARTARVRGLAGVHARDDGRPSTRRRRRGCRRGRDVHGDRPPAAGGPSARRLVHARLLLAAPRGAHVVHRAAADEGVARLPSLGLRERGARPRAAPAGPDARRGRRARPAPSHLRHLEAARRPALGRPDRRLARPVPASPLQARPDERLDG